MSSYWIAAAVFGAIAIAEFAADVIATFLGA